jgi:hypothetical protein
VLNLNILVFIIFSKKIEKSEMAKSKKSGYISSIQGKVVLLIVLCIIIEILVVVSINLYSYFDAVDSTAKQALQISRDRFKSLEIHDVTLMSSTMDALKSDREIRNIFISKNRDRLLDVTSPLFSVLKQKYGITHWYFINPEPDSTCFLRVHSPQQFGDKIGRITYRNALKSGSAGSGLELGKNSIRTPRSSSIL